jgi:hypothetical protein
LDEKRRYILLCIFQAIVLAKAASALLALGLGTALAVFATRKVRLHMAFMSLAVIGLTIAAILHFTPQSRVAILLVEFLDNPMEIIHRDVSLNFRLGGLIASFSFIMNDYLLPHGLAHSTWLQSTALIRSANPWLIDISLVGPPSGIGILLFQCGLLILPHIIYMLFAMFSVPTTGWGKIVLYTSIFVIFSQYYIAAPPFALIFGLSLVKRKKPRTWVKGELGQEFEFKQSMVANRIAL